MADIKDLKITEDKTRGKHVADLPVNPTENGMSAQELQGQFDALPEVVIEAFNTLLDYLVANGAGDKITAATVGAVAKNSIGYSAPNDNLNLAIEFGYYKFTPNTLNAPYDGYGEVLVCPWDQNTLSQLAFVNNLNKIFFRTTAVGNGEWLAWNDIGGDFKSDGSVPMSGAIVFSRNGCNADIYPNDDGFLEFKAYKNWNYRRWITLASPEANATLADAITMHEVVPERWTPYRIFGEHNKELLSGEMLALPSIANGYDTGDSAYWVDADGTGHIILRIAISGGKNIGETAVAKLPVGARPNRRCDIAVLCQKASSVEVALGYITSSGDVFIWNPSGQTIYYVYGEFVYKVAN